MAKGSTEYETARHLLKDRAAEVESHGQAFSAEKFPYSPDDSKPQKVNLVKQDDWNR